MADDPWSDPDVKAWMARASEELVPKLEASHMTLSLVKGETASEGDLKLAIELGLSVLMDKPILVVVVDGEPIAAKLVGIADAVVNLHRGEMGTPAGMAKVTKAITKMRVRLGLEEEES